MTLESLPQIASGATRHVLVRTRAQREHLVPFSKLGNWHHCITTPPSPPLLYREAHKREKKS